MFVRLVSRLTPMLLAVVLMSGCRKEYPEALDYYLAPYPKKEVKDGVDTKVLEKYEKPQLAANIAAGLQPVFGTPRHPRVEIPEAIQNDPEMRLATEHLERGGLLYRNLCLSCHGLVGDGSGPTGTFLDPKPRDFRQGLFKFRSTVKNAPSREDLKRTLRNGVPGASMPAFGMLGEDDLDDLVSYVIHLVLRGKVERYLASELMGGSSDEPAGQVEEDRAKALAEEEATFWMEEAKQVYQPGEPTGGWEKFYEEGVKTNWKKGQDLYLDRAACVQCHGKDGRSSTVGLPTNRTRTNSWGDPLLPRDLTLGVYRGGSRPIDIFYRMKLGILGGEMPAAETGMTDDDIWHVVYYVLTFPRG